MAKGPITGSPINRTMKARIDGQFDGPPMAGVKTFPYRGFEVQHALLACHKDATLGTGGRTTHTDCPQPCRFLSAPVRRDSTTMNSPQLWLEESPTRTSAPQLSRARYPSTSCPAPTTTKNPRQVRLIRAGRRRHRRSTTRSLPTSNLGRACAPSRISRVSHFSRGCEPPGTRLEVCARGFGLGTSARAGGSISGCPVLLPGSMRLRAG